MSPLQPTPSHPSECPGSPVVYSAILVYWVSSVWVPSSKSRAGSPIMGAANQKLTRHVDPRGTCMLLGYTTIRCRQGVQQKAATCVCGITSHESSQRGVW